MNILAFAGSNSSKSINHKLIKYVAKLLEHNVEVIRLTDYNFPLYSIDIEENDGFPKDVKLLHSQIRAVDAVIISVSEHNGNISAFFKNILDWISRYDRKFLEGKKWVLFSAAPGKRGGKSALEIAQKTLNYFKGELVGTCSIGHFKTTFVGGKIVVDDKEQEVRELLSKL